VDLITPTLNRACALPTVWASLKSQTESRFHWIIVDNGSTDDTAEVVRGFEDPRITFVFEPRKGANAARTRGEQEVRSTYVIFLDSDNRLYDDDTLRVMLEAVESAPAEAGCVGFTCVDEQGREAYSFIKKERTLVTYEDVVCEKEARGEFLFIYKTEALDVAPWPECNGMECLRHWAIAKRYPQFFVRRPAQVYQIGGDSISGAAGSIARAAEMAPAIALLISDHRDAWIAACPEQHGRYLFYAAMYHALAGQTRDAFRYCTASWSAKGPRIKGVVLLKSLLLPTSLRRKLFTVWAKRARVGF
jgi:glycosyltransferase involved in cell wall biosynthesis